MPNPTPNTGYGPSNETLERTSAPAYVPYLSIFTNFDHLNREMFTIFDRDFHGH